MARCFRVRLSVAFFSILLAVVLMTRPIEAAPRVEAYGQLPAISDVEVSPDGRHIAMIQGVQGREVVMIYTVDASAKPVMFNPDNAKVRSIRWANSERLLVWLSVTHKEHQDRYKRTFEFWRIMSLNTEGQDGVFLFRDKKFTWVVSAGAIVSMLPDDPDHVLIAQLDPSPIRTFQKAQDTRLPSGKKRDDPPYDVYKVNVRTGKAEQFQRGNPDTEGWIADGRGQVRVRIDTGYKDDRIFVSGGDGRFAEIKSAGEDGDSGGPVNFYGFGNDPKKIYVAARRGSDRLGLYLYDLGSGGFTDQVFTHALVDISGALTDRYSGRVIGVEYVDHVPQSVYFDKGLAETYGKLKGAFKGKSVSIFSSSRDGARHMVLVEGPRDPGAFYFFDKVTRQVSPLGSRYPELKPSDLGEVRAISYTARDGLTIPAYLTLPPGKEPKNLPLIMLPHGGPEIRDDQTFDWWAQFYASRGYAVLQPNFRGSDGFGRKFVMAGYGEYGRKMQDDLTDGVKYAVAQGIADPERVCIIGGSYGGYAALAGVTLTPDVYACAVSVAGISDLAAKFATIYRQSGNVKDSTGEKYWERWIGDKSGDAKVIKDLSPVTHAAAVRAPVLLIHGKDDTVVAYRQSELMAEALKKAGKPHKFVALEGEDHWLTQGESRIRILKETEAFLAEHLGR